MKVGYAMTYIQSFGIEKGGYLTPKNSVKSVFSLVMKAFTVNNLVVRKWGTW